jgi:hypothetical protein
MVLSRALLLGRSRNCNAWQAPGKDVVLPFATPGVAGWQERSIDATLGCSCGCAVFTSTHHHRLRLSAPLIVNPRRHSMTRPQARTLATVRLVLAAAAVLVCLPGAQASTAAYDAMVDSGFTEEGIFARIVIRDDVGLAGSATFASNPLFSGVVGVGTAGGSYCSGALIAPTVVLSARHCGPTPGDQVRFGANYAGGITFSISAVSFPGGGTSGSPLLNGGDVAIVTLASPVSSAIATPFLLTADTTALLGAQVVTLGYGGRGIGSTGATLGTGVRLGGTNVLDRYGLAVNSSSTIPGSANIFSTDFDNPAGTSNTLGWAGSSAVATATEATTAGGDSGGPLLTLIGGQWAVMGVLSGGSTDNSVYGDISWWTGLAPFTTQITTAGGVFISVIPEPGSYVLMLVGLGLVGARLRSARSAA